MGKVYIPFSDPKGAKTIPFNWGAHTYVAYIKVYPSGSVCEGRPRFLSCQFPSKYSRRLFVLSLIWLPWLDKITCMHPNEHCYREVQLGNVSCLLLSRDKWSRKIKNKSKLRHFTDQATLRLKRWCPRYNSQVMHLISSTVQIMWSG